MQSCNNKAEPNVLWERKFTQLVDLKVTHCVFLSVLSKPWWNNCLILRYKDAVIQIVIQQHRIHCDWTVPFTYFSVESLEFAASSEHVMFPPIKQDFNSEKLQTDDRRRHTDDLFTICHQVNLIFCWVGRSKLTWSVSCFSKWWSVTHFVIHLLSRIV